MTTTLHRIFPDNLQIAPGLIKSRVERLEALVARVGGKINQMFVRLTPLNGQGDGSQRLRARVTLRIPHLPATVIATAECRSADEAIVIAMHKVESKVRRLRKRLSTNSHHYMSDGAWANAS